MSFLERSDMRDIKHTPAQALCSGMFCQHKPDSMLLVISFPVIFLREKKNREDKDGKECDENILYKILNE